MTKSLQIETKNNLLVTKIWGMLRSSELPPEFTHLAMHTITYLAKHGTDVHIVSGFNENSNEGVYIPAARLRISKRLESCNKLRQSLNYVISQRILKGNSCV